MGEVREIICSNLKRYIAESGYTQKEVSEKLGVSKSSVTNWISGKNSPDVELVIPLCKLLNITVKEFFGELENQSEAKVIPLLSTEMEKIALRYSKLDTYGKSAVQAVMSTEEVRIKEQAKLDLTLIKPEPKIIPLFWSAAAAGIASPILGDDYDHYELTPEDPPGAMFAVRVRGDSMEPHFPDGSIAFCNKDPMADGDIGIFCLDGESFIKQYHYDRIMGMTYLFSLNRNRSDADKLITRSSGQTLTCMGRVMTLRRYPLPRLSR